MIAFIAGRVAEIASDRVVLECGGIGYELQVSSFTLQKAAETGKSIQLFTYLKSGDDGLTLFGFYSAEEKNMFMRLITVSGVGPRMAMALLSGISVRELALCIMSGDTKALTRAKGIGKKIAERIVLELKESVRGQIGDLPGPAAGPAVDGSPAGDALSALLALGLSRTEAQTAVDRALAAGADTAEGLIAQALRALG